MPVISMGTGRAVAIVQFLDVLEGQGIFFWDWFEVLHTGCSCVEEYVVASTSHMEGLDGGQVESALR